MPINHALSDADYIRFRDLVHTKSGLDFSGLRRPDLERAVQGALVETATPDAGSLFRVLTEEGQGRLYLEAFIARLTIGETHFFRNRPQFEALERHILPDIIARRRALRRLRLWSAGCSSGEEPYSLAILLRRLLPDLANWNVLILATDINAEALEKARRGVYGPWSFRGVPPETQHAYFSRNGRELAVVPQIRDMVTFAYLNLVEDMYPSLLTNTNAMDLIVCRNVTIYFLEETTRRVAGRFCDALTEGGWLVVGHTEPSQAIYHQFAAHNFPGTVVYQKGPAERPAPERWNAQPPPAEPPSVAPRGTQAHQSVSQYAPTRIDKPQTTDHLPLATREPRFARHDRPPTDQASQITEDGPYQEALALWEANRPDQALQRLEALTAADPRDARAPYLAAKIAANRVQLVAAEHWIELALKRAPLVAAGHYLHALILQEGNRPEEALAALRRCVYIDPHFVLGHVLLANLCARLGQPRRARKALETVAHLLADRQRDELIPEGEGLTVGRLLELVTTPPA